MSSSARTAYTSAVQHTHRPYSIHIVRTEYTTPVQHTHRPYRIHIARTAYTSPVQHTHRPYSIESQIKFKPITDELCFGFMPGRVFPDWGASSPELVLSEEDEKNQLSWIM